MKTNIYHLLKSFLKKEVQLLFSTKNIFIQSIIFSLGMIFIFQFSIKSIPYSLVINESTTSQISIQYYTLSHFYIYIGVFWLIHTITSLFIILNSFYWEQESGAFYVLKTVGVSHQIFFLAKLLTITLALYGIWCIEIVAWYIGFFDTAQHIFFTMKISTKILMQLCMLGLINAFSFSIIGIISAVISLNTKYPFIFISILFLPIVFPSILLSAQCTRNILNNINSVSFNWYDPLFNILIGFCFLYFGISILIYKYLWEE